MLYSQSIALYPGTFGQYNWNHWVIKNKKDINLRRQYGDMGGGERSGRKEVEQMDVI